MCGITGFIGFGRSERSENLESLARGMVAALRHRGPDDAGAWVDPESGVGLGHSRLAIVDLSPQGRQPMFSRCGRFVVVFNGEIYNHHEIRRELEQRRRGVTWRGHSDTEVMLAAFDAWGVEAALKRFVGMFAFALWDRSEQVLYLGRDRMGEKPLYYGWQGESFLFGSELKALRRHRDWRGELNRDALALYLRLSYVPAPYTIYSGIRALEPGCLLTLQLREGAAAELAAPQPYWSPREVAENGVRDPFTGGDEEAVDRLDALLRQAIGKQMLADVPLGAFLSGGVDSSTIVALMQAQSNRPVRTFTIGFDAAAYDEASYAREGARHLGTDHTELYVTSRDALDVIPRLPTLYDEPFGDVSQIPTFLVSQLTRNHVTVSLSGDGGDELFGGYNRYFWAPGIWDRIGSLPKQARVLAARLIKSRSARSWDALFESFAPILPGRLKQRNPGSKLHKLAGILDAATPFDLYLRLVSQWRDPGDLVLGGLEPGTVLSERGRHPQLQDFSQLMMYLDAVSYLPGDILVKVDRASMGVSLESRTPFLDHRIFEYAWRLPMSMKIRGGEGKWILRQVLYRYVPKALIERPKAGFAVPLESWLRGPLREWGEELLDEKRLIREGILNPAPIRKKWLEHLSGREDWQHYLWNVLMFQAWLQEEKVALPSVDYLPSGAALHEPLFGSSSLAAGAEGHVPLAL
jgi:asparagine synthase (glutamine-hydrolysing)